jgi:transcriptional regulator with XRE-family HTH domain
MVKSDKPQTVFSIRMKHARLRAGLTQMELGVNAGIEEFSASARINQYERAVHMPDYGTSERLAHALAIPVSYLYEADDTIAEIILRVGELNPTGRNKFLSILSPPTDEPSPLGQ